MTDEDIEMPIRRSHEFEARLIRDVETFKKSFGIQKPRHRPICSLHSESSEQTGLHKRSPWWLHKGWLHDQGQVMTASVSKWQIPDEILRVEDIPMTATGKIDKKPLKRKFGEYFLFARGDKNF